MPDTLLQICAKFLAKTCCEYEMFDLLSSFQWPQKALDCFWKSVPLNYFMALEKQLAQKDVDFFWNRLVSECKERNCAFKMRLKMFADPFTISFKHAPLDVSHHRQVLVNSLFQEALDIGLYSKMGKTGGIPAFALHDSLRDNAPNIDTIAWLCTLSKSTSLLMLHPRHATLLHEYAVLVNNICVHCQRIDLLLNSTLNTLSLLQTYCKVVQKLLSGSNCKTVVVFNLQSLNDSNSILKICSGQVTAENVGKLNNAECDVWDFALGEHYDDGHQLEIDKNESESLYDNLGFVSSNNDIDTQNSNPKQLVVEISSLKLRLSLSNFTNLEAIKISFVTRPLVSMTQVDVLNEIEILAANPSSNLKRIFLQTIVIGVDQMVKFLQAMYASYVYRNKPLDEIRITDCLIYCEDSGDNVFKEVSNLINSSQESALQHLYLDRLEFSDSHAQAMFCRHVFNTLPPKELSVINFCVNQETCCSVNLELFLFAARTLQTSKLNQSIKSCHIFIPSPVHVVEAELLSALQVFKLETFTLYHESCDTISKKLCDCLKKLVHNFYIQDINFCKPDSSHTIEDYVAQM